MERSNSFCGPFRFVRHLIVSLLTVSLPTYLHAHSPCQQASLPACARACSLAQICGGLPSWAEKYFSIYRPRWTWYSPCSEPNRNLERGNAMKFKELQIGAEFDWIDDANPTWNSFYLRCTKISARKYSDTNGVVHRVGCINAVVYHCGQ